MPSIPDAAAAAPDPGDPPAVDTDPTGAAAGTPPQGGAAGLVLSLAGDLTDQDRALDAELLLSTLLGAVYAVTGPDRGRIQARFTARLSGLARTTGTPAATAVAALLRRWEHPDGDAAGPAEAPGSTDAGVGSTDAGAAGDSRPPAGDGAPAWLPEAGRVRVTGAWAYGDRYGDQTGYVATFAYADEALGGPEHAVLVVADHNAGMAVDVLVTAPAEETVRGLREAVAADPDRMSWFTATAPATVRAAATAYLRLTDLATELPDNDSLSANRALALARIALLPSGTTGPADAPAAPDAGTVPASGAVAAPGDAPAEAVPVPDGAGTGGAGPHQATSPDGAAPDAAVGGPLPEAVLHGATLGGIVATGGGPDVAHSRVVADAATRSRLVREFLDSPEADIAGLTEAGPAAESVRYCADLVVDFAATARAGDPLRWSPTAVGRFLLDWVHTRAVLDREDVATLPRVLSAWVLWAGHRLGIPRAAVRRTLDACRAHRAEFERLCASGERQSEASRAAAGMVAAGLDPDDPAQVVAWLDDQRGGA